MVASDRLCHHHWQVMEIWTIKDIKDGEELFIDYGDNFVPCDWYDELAAQHGLTPLSQLSEAIEKMLAEK